MMKTVHFKTTPTIHLMYVWNFAYRSARQGEWQIYARDHERFGFRIQQTSVLLNKILMAEHRNKIYNERFIHS